MSGTCRARLASRSCANWSSDANGNLTVENYVGNITNCTFDTENRLTKVVQVSGYTEENEYSRDGLRRVRLAGDSTVTYLWDDYVLLRDNSIFTKLPGAPGGLLSAKVGGDHRFYVPDMQGHVRQVTDVDGDAIAEYQYDAWGLIQLTAASAMAFGDWGYTWDGKPGRYYVQQRHLRADLGRWMSVDPVETEPPYSYVGDRPTWAVDPTGEQSVTPPVDRRADRDFILHHRDTPEMRERRRQYDEEQEALALQEWERANGTIDRGGRPGGVEYAPWRRSYHGPLADPFSALANGLDWVVSMMFAASEAPYRFIVEQGDEVAASAIGATGLGRPGRALRQSFVSYVKSSGNETLAALVPPGPVEPGRVAWYGGMYRGIAEACALCVLNAPSDILRLVSVFLSEDSPFLTLWKGVVQAYDGLLKAPADLRKQKPYDRGKTIGILLGGAILLLVTAAKGVPTGLTRLLKVPAIERATRTARAVVALKVSKVPSAQDFEALARNAFTASRAAAHVHVPKIIRLPRRTIHQANTPHGRYEGAVLGNHYDGFLIDGRQVWMDGVYDPVAKVITDAKWAGDTAKQWAISRYNPASTRYLQAAVDRCIAQARLYIMLNRALKGNGIRLLVSWPGARQHFEEVMRRHFPNAVASGGLRVYHVPNPE